MVDGQISFLLATDNGIVMLFFKSIEIMEKFTTKCYTVVVKRSVNTNL